MAVIWYLSPDTKQKDKVQVELNHVTFQQLLPLTSFASIPTWSSLPFLSSPQCTQSGIQQSPQLNLKLNSPSFVTSLPVLYNELPESQVESLSVIVIRSKQSTVVKNVVSEFKSLICLYQAIGPITSHLIQFSVSSSAK